MQVSRQVQESGCPRRPLALRLGQGLSDPLAFYCLVNSAAICWSRCGLQGEG
jgi:hypothetical protein